MFWLLASGLLLASVIFIALLLNIINRLIPNQYNFRCNLFGAAAVLLSIATGFALNIELEGGILSGAVFMLIASAFWGLVLVGAWFIYIKASSATHKT